MPCTPTARPGGLMLQTAAVCALLTLIAPPAGAHGDRPHAAKPPAVAEQTDWGIAGQARASKRRIVVRMGDDMRFRPDQIDVQLGETVTFEIRNEGKVLHEFVLGTRPELDKHAALMLKFPDMEHDAPYMAHVAPGKTGTIVWAFNRAGTFDFACLIAGHYQAGMVGRVRVAAR